MSCVGCNQISPINFISPVTPCVSYPNACGTSIDSSCVIYSGPELSCSDVEPNSSVQVALQAMDAAICAGISINWSGFNYYCLPGLCSCTITTAQQFVETISNQFCTLRTAYDTFSGTTYVAGIASLQSQIDGIKAPTLTSCGAVGVISGDTLVQVLTKILTNLCTVNTNITTNLSTANWNQCLSVGSAPTTLIGAVNTLIDQICQVYALIPSATILPVFNNVGTCLATPTTSDTLVQTIIKIRTLLCTLPTLDISSLTSTCATVGSGLQDTLQNIITNLDTATENTILQTDGNLSITNINDEAPCAGKKISFIGSGSTDRLVAVQPSDASPGTLVDKLAEGTNVTFDISTSPGQLIINALGPDGKVAVQAGDTTDYLINKINIKSDSANIVSWNSVYNSTTKQLDITPSFNLVTLATDLLAAIIGDAHLTASWCAFDCACNCDSTTTTTTTTTSPEVTVFARIQNLSSTTTMQTQVTFSQLSPTVAWYNSSAVSISPSSQILTGSFAVTAATPVTGVLTIKNNNNVSITYNVTVVDDSAIPVPGSSTLSGTITATNTLTSNPFTYGTSPNNYHLLITLTF